MRRRFFLSGTSRGSDRTLADFTFIPSATSGCSLRRVRPLGRVTVGNWNYDWLLYSGKFNHLNHDGACVRFTPVGHDRDPVPLRSLPPHHLAASRETGGTLNVELLNSAASFRGPNLVPIPKPSPATNNFESRTGLTPLFLPN